MRSRTRVVCLGLLLGAMFLGCTRYPSIPARETIEPQSSGTRPIISPPSTGAVPTAAGAAENYTIGPEDVLQIEVWDHDDLSRDVPVSQTGDFTFPLIGQVAAAGRSVEDVEKDMIARLADGYLVNPQVTVTVKEFRSKKVHVMGEVKSPGTFPLAGTTTVVEIISKAGGTTPAAGTDVMVVRPRDPRLKEVPISLEEAAGAAEVIPLDLRAIQEGDVSQNVRLQHGDTVIVPKAKNFFVFGEVKSPGQFQYERGITVLKAITIAGGITEKAAPNRTHIVREKGGVREEISVSMSDFVEPNDIVMVPESFF
jgi:polysaccharide export outer membrane protein